MRSRNSFPIRPVHLLIFLLLLLLAAAVVETISHLLYARRSFPGGIHQEQLEGRPDPSGSAGPIRADRSETLKQPV